MFEFLYSSIVNQSAQAIHDNMIFLSAKINKEIEQCKKNNENDLTETFQKIYNYISSSVNVAINMYDFNSEEFDGLTVEDAKVAITNKVVKLGCGRVKVNYRLREWIFARQRYWGEPIPIIHLENGQTIALADEKLPLILPELEDYKPEGCKSPFAK